MFDQRDVVHSALRFQFTAVRDCWCKKRGFALRQSPFSCLRNDISGLAVTSFESFNTPGSVNKFLLAGEKRVTGRADFGVDLLTRGACLERVAAQAPDSYIGIHWVNTFFHLFLLQYCVRVDVNYML